MNSRNIGLLMNASPLVVISILGILKSGACVVPLSRSMPMERLRFIIADAHIDGIITDNENFGIVSELINSDRIINTEAEMVPSSGSKLHPASVNDNCYIIYTSGSTGQPKGVAISHSNFCPMLFWAIDYFRLNRDVKVIQNLSYVFDFGIFELLTSVISGAELHFVSNADPSVITDYINRTGINFIHTTPSFMNYLLSAGIQMSSLKQVHLGGEEVNPQLIKLITERTIPSVKIYNGYGPTECTVNATIFECNSKSDEGRFRIPIGKPSANNYIYILSRGLQMQPVGIPGEICIGGAGLAAGYLKQPKLTAEKFIPHPFRRGEQLYRTGDLGRWLPEGNIEFIGRTDDQVKIRGFRIEINELENVLQRHEKIKSAAVIVRINKENEKELIAYIISSQKIVSSQLHTWLGKQVPAYMLPSYYVQLNEMPLTSNGKVNKKDLPDPELMEMHSGVDYVEARTETELKLVQIWKEILGKEKIGVKDDFFQLGGHSLKAISAIARIKKEFEIDIDLRTVFMEPTIEHLAGKIDNDLWLQDSFTGEGDQYEEVEV